MLPPATLWWDPVRPLTGPGDWLERVRWNGDGIPGSLRRDFDSQGQVQPTVVRRPLERRKFVHALRALLEGNPTADPALVGLLRREQGSLARQLDAAPTATETKRALTGPRVELDDACAAIRAWVTATFG